VIERCFEVGGALCKHEHYAHGYGSEQQYDLHTKIAYALKLLNIFVNINHHLSDNGVLIDL
jgi:hypothetical protein